MQSEDKWKANDSVKTLSGEMVATRETQKSSVEDLEGKFRRELNASFSVPGVESITAKAVRNSKENGQEGRLWMKG